MAGTRSAAGGKMAFSGGLSVQVVLGAWRHGHCQQESIGGKRRPAAVTTGDRRVRGPVLTFGREQELGIGLTGSHCPVPA